MEKCLRFKIKDWKVKKRVIQLGEVGYVDVWHTFGENNVSFHVVAFKLERYNRTLRRVLTWNSRISQESRGTFLYVVMYHQEICLKQVSWRVMKRERQLTLSNKSPALISQRHRNGWAAQFLKCFCWGVVFLLLYVFCDFGEV